MATEFRIRASGASAPTDSLGVMRERLYEKIKPLERAESNHIRQVIAGRARDAADYLHLTSILDLDPKWEGLKPWRSA